MDSKKILVLGSSGFVGKAVAHQLSFSRMDCKYDILTPMHKECDLLNFYPSLLNYIIHNQPDEIYNCVGYNGGLPFNLKNQAAIFFENTVSGLNLLQVCIGLKKRPKVLSLVTSCAYPDFDYYPNFTKGGYSLEERFFFDGQPNESVSCHGYAKRNIQLATTFYHNQYGLDAVCVCPTTTYGPGDRFDLERSKVMAALIKKFVDAKDNNEKSVQLLGNGEASRDFIYIDNAASLIIKSMEKYEDSSRPLNLAVGQTRKIKDLAREICDEVGFKGTIEFESDETGNGQNSKTLDNSRMKKILFDNQYFGTVSLSWGIRETVKYYNTIKSTGAH